MIYDPRKSSLLEDVDKRELAKIQKNIQLRQQARELTRTHWFYITAIIGLIILFFFFSVTKVEQGELSLERKQEKTPKPILRKKETNHIFASPKRDLRSEEEKYYSAIKAQEEAIRLGKIGKFNYCAIECKKKRCEEGHCTWDEGTKNWYINFSSEEEGEEKCEQYIKSLQGANR